MLLFVLLFLTLVADVPALDAFVACMLVVVYAEAVVDVTVPVVVDVVVLFDPFLPDAVVDKDEVDVEADADVLRDAVLN